MLASSKIGGLPPLSPLAQATIEKHLPGTKKLLQKTLIIQKRDASCITDICGSESLPEVEIFSLLEEQIPKYKIRSDSLTKFGGYENQDWYIPFPALKLKSDEIGLTKDQIRETLNYFLLSGERVSHMTRAYDDIEAVTRLLEEKEKDLELTVQIGKELLTQNNRLENRVSDLEFNLKTIKDNFQQLSHELHQKNELIAILTNDVDNDVSSSSILDTETPATTPTSSKFINLDLLQKKISSLQDENVKLRREAHELIKETDDCEEKEKQLMEDIANQLNSTNNQFDDLNLELERYKEDNRMLNEQMYNLTSRLTETEIRFHELNNENEETSSILSITKENQNLLANELAEFKLRYQEVLALLNETQEQLRNARKRVQPVARSTLLCGMPVPQADSLQSELMETSMFSEHSLDSGIALERNRCSSIGGMSNNNNSNVPGYKKIFETVRCVSKSNNFSDNSNMLHLGVMSMSSSSQPKMSAFVNLTDSGIAQSCRSSSGAYTNSICASSTEGSLGARASSRESLISTDLETNYPAHQPLGCPGAPGAKDLEAALNRLTPAEILARRAMLSHAPAGTYTYDEHVPVGCRTPDSIMSLGGYSMTASGTYSHPQWRLPEKLQIIKPMEGSQTLRNWNRLATPNLSGLFEERPGVTIRGGRGLDDLGLQVYSLSDCEEDIDDNPGKRFPSSSCVYTYTNSTVMHPDDGTSVISSMPSSQVASRSISANVSRHTSAPMTPRSSLSRRNSCSTFSVSLGLASMLNERGIKAVTPSALNTPCGVNFTPTVTPCNSPEGSPGRLMSPEPQFLSGLLSTGADMLRRKLIGEAMDSKHQKLRPGNKIILSRLEKRALKSIKILEKVEHMGIESIAPSSSSICTLPPLHGSSTLYSNRSSSPMAQLTSLKKLNTSDGEEVRIDRETIKAVLTKGLSSENSSIISDDSTNSKSSSTFSTPKQLKSSSSDDIENTISNTSRMKHMQRQKSRRSIKNGHGGQRPDLGTVGSSAHKLYKKSDEKNENQSIGFIGSISSLLFGRKGGLL